MLRIHGNCFVQSDLCSGRYHHKSTEATATVKKKQQRGNKTRNI